MTNLAIRNILLDQRLILKYSSFLFMWHSIIYNKRFVWKYYFIYSFFFMAFVYGSKFGSACLTSLNYWSYINLFKYYKYIIVYYSLVLKLIEFNFFWKGGFVYLPKKYKQFTILRSPHTDKRSREQFEFLRYNTVLHYPNFFALNNFFFFKDFFFFYENVSFINYGTFLR